MTTSKLIIGDVHQKIYPYYAAIKRHGGPSIQVGDFGFGEYHKWHLEHLDSNLHKINFGNHDDYNYLHHPHSLSNFSYDAAESLMTIRGAASIDKWKRHEGIDWFPNEQLNYKEMGQAIELAEQQKPRIIISHDCPEEIRDTFFNISIKSDPRNKSITTQSFQELFERHQPDMWVFGHYHQSINEVVNGTRFICLAELETFLLEV
jgi:hypothetical protein